MIMKQDFLPIQHVPELLSVHLSRHHILLLFAKKILSFTDVAVVVVILTGSVVGIFASFGGTDLLIDRKGIGEGEWGSPFRERAFNMTDCERAFFNCSLYRVDHFLLLWGGLI